MLAENSIIHTSVNSYYWLQKSAHYHDYTTAPRAVLDIPITSTKTLESASQPASPIVHHARQCCYYQYRPKGFHVSNHQPLYVRMYTSPQHVFCPYITVASQNLWFQHQYHHRFNNVPFFSSIAHKDHLILIHIQRKYE